MAKTAPAKQQGRTSVHSRAARRATSPGIDLDKSIKEVKPPKEVKIQRASVLAVHQGAGVSKKSKNGRKSDLSSKAKKRQERGMDRAEAFADKKVKKIEKSKDRARTVQGRAKAWEELNKNMIAKKAREEAHALAKENGEVDEKEDWVDMNEDEVEMGNGIETTEVPATEAMVTEATAATVPLPVPVEDEEEIL